MKSEQWVINRKTLTYMVAQEPLDDDWKEQFPHTKNEDGYANLEVVTVYDSEDLMYGIKAAYDLCPDGALFTVLIDKDKHTTAQIEEALDDLRERRDVVGVCKMILHQHSPEPEELRC